MVHHICLDLDNTLICSCFEEKQISQINLNDPRLNGRYSLITLVDTHDTLNKKGVGVKYRFLIAYRPYLKEFINFMISYFTKISIWSAGQERYVRAIEYLLFPTTNMNNTYSFKDTVFLEDGTTFKELLQKEFNLEETFAIDDRDDTFSKNVENGILIPPYRPEFTTEGLLKDDDTLLKLINWFKKKEVMNSKDIRLLDKSNIFN